MGKLHNNIFCNLPIHRRIPIFKYAHKWATTFGARGGNRTPMVAHQILSLARLPVPPPSQKYRGSLPDSSAFLNLSPQALSGDTPINGHTTNLAFIIGNSYSG